ncbi:MAG: tyrosine-type recombinase/integrase [Alphaproteobacteria bacterium]
MAAAALEFTILTAARTGEVIGARWPEIDQANNVWTIPPARTKAGREHRIPLSRQALAVLHRMAPLRRDDGYVFPGRDKGRPLSNMAMLVLLERMKRNDLTVHGFRSTFRDWTAERTNFPQHVAEMALGHSIPDAVEAAYRRGELLQKRQQLAQGWGDFCDRAPAATVGDVVPMSEGQRRRPEAQAAG